VKTNKAAQVNIRVEQCDLLAVRRVLNGSARASAIRHISPTGRARQSLKRAAKSLPSQRKKAIARNLTNTTGVMERDPAWSPDGKWISYFSDESGEYQLCICAIRKATGEVRKKFTDQPPYVLLFSPTWSPDSKKIALHRQTTSIFGIWTSLKAQSRSPSRWTHNPIGLQRRRDGAELVARQPLD
jgi:tricorn protease